MPILMMPPRPPQVSELLTMTQRCLSGFAASTVSRNFRKVNQGLPALPTEMLESLHLRLFNFVLLRPYPRRTCRNRLYTYQVLLSKKLVHVMRDFESRNDPEDMQT